MKYINNLTLKKLKIELNENLNLKPFRGEQLFRWIHDKKITDLSEIKNLTDDMINKIKENYKLDSLEKVQIIESKEDNTKKYLFKLDDGNIIESVYMEYKHGNSICVSSQAGCSMNCKFCASTKNGLARNLRASEMLEQVYSIERDLNTTVDSVVVMGTGEPFENFENLLDFLEVITCDKGKNLSKRKITISTCGIVKKIYELAEKEQPYSLAISLHSPIQKNREELVPSAKKYKIQEIIAACDYYYNKTNRRVTYEYILIEGYNDREEDKLELIKLLKDQNCLVNIISLNPIKEFDGKSPNRDKMSEFKNFLKKNGVNATVRRKLGRDIDGACGQLRRKFK
ncbi:MAG: 23S rRNA (adenine(2503)-C(2))-methyltransferase RlmN [Bacillota bacterium]|nr:23S rRNA (adenine(2503)-C(2))-methyltransferase RlmN [Bacillota bacterium]